jgi:hypothetical protein
MEIVATYISGILTIFVGLFHLRLNKLRNWKEKLKDVDVYNQRVIYTINLALAIMFFGIGILSFIYTKELSNGSGLAFGFNLSLCCFWVWRVIWGKIYLKNVSDHRATFFDVIKNSVGPILIISYLLPIITSTFN